jgi:hypothetical protein
MPSASAAFRADGCEREAMALVSHQALFCMAGITFCVAIRAVPSTPQTTFLMCHPREPCRRILGRASGGGFGKSARRRLPAHLGTRGAQERRITGRSMARWNWSADS